MIVEEVTLKDFLSHRNTSVKFPLGVIALIGPNGAGKTSILDAISFALLKENSRGRGLEELIRRRSKSCEVRVRFKVGNRSYLLVRTLCKVGRNVRGDALLYRDGKLIARGDREVSRELSNVIPVDRSLFLNAVYVRQGEIDRLLTVQPHERKKVIGKLLKLDDLEGAWNNMRELIYDYREKLAKLEGIVKSKEDYERKAREALAELREVEGELTELLKELKASKDKLTEVERELGELEAKGLEYVKIRSELNNLSKLRELLLEEVRKLAKELKEIVRAERELNYLKDSISLLPLYEEYYETLRELGKLEDVIKVLEGRWRELGELKELAESKRGGYERYLRLEGELRGLKRKLEELKEVPGIYRRLLSDRERVERELRKLEDELKVKLKEYGLTSPEEVGDLSFKVRELEELLYSLRERKGSLLTKLSELEDRLSKLMSSDSCPLCGARLSYFKREELTHRTSSEVSSLRSRVEALNKEIARVGGELEEFKGMEVKLREIVSKYEAKMKSLKSKLGELEEEIGKVKPLYEEYLTLEKRMAEVNETLEGLFEDYKDYLAAVKGLKGSGELLRELERYRSKARELKVRLKSLEGEVKLKPSEIGEELKKLREAKSKFDRLSGLTSRKEELLKELLEDRNKLRELRSKEEELTRRLKELNYDEVKHSSLKEEREELSTKLRGLEERRAELEAGAKSLKEKLLEYESALREVERAEKEYWKLRSFVDFLVKLRELYGKDGIQRKIRNLAKPLIERNVRELIKLFDLDYFDVKVDDDYNLTLIGPLGEHTVNMISGGERVALALALRLALAKVVAGSEMEFMLLDEPTVHLDEERRRDLVKVLRKVFSEKGIIPQLIIVTHDRELEDAADVIYRVEKGSDGSIIKRVEGV